MGVFLSTTFFFGALRTVLRPRFLTADASKSSLTSAMLSVSNGASAAVSDNMLVSSSLLTTELPTKGDHRNASGSNSSRDFMEAIRSACDLTIVQSIQRMTLFFFF